MSHAASALRPFLAQAMALLALALCGGCAPEAEPPELVKLVEVTPRAVRGGDRMEILGVGFGSAEMREASVELVGELSRAGEAARSKEHIAIPVAHVSYERVTFAAQEALLARICGRGDDARHTTFRGDVVVTFHPTGSGRTAVRGTVHDVTLDFLPPDGRRAITEARRDAARSVLGHLGVRLTEEAPSAAPGLLIEEVARPSRAAEAGLQAGELLVAVDGVTVLAVDDASPRGGSTTASFRTRARDAADDKGDRTTAISVVGVTPTSAGELGAATAILAPAAALVLFFASPLGRAWGAFELRYRTRPRRREEREPQPRRPAEWIVSLARHVVSWPAHAIRALAGEMGADRRGSEVPSWAAFLVFAGVSAMLCALPFGQRIVATDLDLGVLVLPAFALLVLCGAFSGLLSAPRWWMAPFSAVWSAIRAAVWQVPVLAAMTYAVLRGGSLRIADLADAQAGSAGGGLLTRGSWPWHALALSGPVPLLLLLAALATLAVEQRFDATGGRSPAQQAERLTESKLARVSSRAHHLLAFFADWAHVFVVSGLLAAVFLGGFRLPGVVEPTPALVALGAAFFLAKSWLLVLVVASVRSALRLAAPHVERIFLAGLVPATLALLIGGALLHEQAMPVQVSTMLRAGTCSVAIALFGLAVLRLHAVGHERLRVSTTNPFR